MDYMLLGSNPNCTHNNKHIAFSFALKQRLVAWCMNITILDILFAYNMVFKETAYMNPLRNVIDICGNLLLSKTFFLKMSSKQVSSGHQVSRGPTYGWKQIIIAHWFTGLHKDTYWFTGNRALQRQVYHIYMHCQEFTATRINPLIIKQRFW